MSTETFVIVGAGLAGAKTGEALRDQGFTGRIVLVGTEDVEPYERPPLSKGYLAGDASWDEVRVHPSEWYAEHQIELKLATEVTAIDRPAHRVTLSDGSDLDYTRLVLATGSTARTLPVPGADAEGVLTLRTRADSDRIKATLAGIGKLVVIGAGWIGLEVTAAARAAGVEVTVLEAERLPLLRAIGPELAAVFADLHVEHGVDLRFGVRVEAITAEGGRASGVRLADGATVPADAVLVGVGARPNVELAEAAGLAVDNGVLVDAALRTSDPDIVAIGDIANAEHPVLHRRVRVEHWATALNQPAVAATTLLGGDAVYAELPYFFTDQYDLGMELIGLVEPDGYDRVVFRGDVSAREFIAFYLRDNRVVAGMNVNVWDVVDSVKALILSGQQVDPDRLADPDSPLPTPPLD